MATTPRHISAALIFFVVLALPLTATSENILYTNDYLGTGQSLTYGNFRFVMQSDCNLVLYDGSSAAWASGTAGRGSNCVVRMQSDGNLVVYNGGQAMWASNSNVGSGNYVCVLQRDRNVVVYGGARWASGTNRFGTGVTVSGRRHLLAGEKNETGTSSSSPSDDSAASEKEGGVIWKAV